MWILLSAERQEKLSSSDKQSEKNSRTNEVESSHLGRTGHLASGAEAAKPPSVPRCCHTWVSWGTALSLPASATPATIKNVVIVTNGQLLSVLSRNAGASDQLQPENENQRVEMFSTLPSVIPLAVKRAFTLNPACSWSTAPTVRRRQLEPPESVEKTSTATSYLMTDDLSVHL